MDIHSYARPSEARVTSVALDLRVDFDARRLIGQATLTIERAPHARSIVLDTRGLLVHAVTDISGRPLTSTLGAAHAVLGTPLEAELPSDNQAIVVRYETGDE